VILWLSVATKKITFCALPKTAVDAFGKYMHRLSVTYVNYVII